MSMFSNQPGNGQQSVSTHIDTIFGEYSYLSFRCWDDKMSFNWVPCNGVTETGRKTYDKDAGVMTSMTHSKVEALLAMYRRKLRDKILNHEDPGDGLSVGVTVQSIDKTSGNASTTGIFIEYANDRNGVPATFFTVAKNLNGGDGARIIQYKFDDIPTLDGGPVAAGQFVEGREAGDFLWFISILEAHALIARYGDHGRKVAEANARQYQARNGGGNYQGSNGGYNSQMMPNPQQQLPADMNIPANMDGFSVFQ